LLDRAVKQAQFTPAYENGTHRGRINVVGNFGWSGPARTRRRKTFNVFSSRPPRLPVVIGLLEMKLADAVSVGLHGYNVILDRHLFALLREVAAA
jgi:hypothetical protein